MTNEYEGRITEISLPCLIQLDVLRHVTIKDHFLDALRIEAEDSRSKIQFRIDLFEKNMGGEEHLDVPVIKYSTENYAPAFSSSIRLRTLNFFRSLAIESTGLRDALEGCRQPHEWGMGSEMTITSEEDGTSIKLDASGANVIDSCHKTFMYCCSLYDSKQVLTRESARNVFTEDYTYGSIFRSSKELAKHIVRSFAATIGREMVESADLPEGNVFSSACAWIVHGPVQYLEDTAPRLPGIESLFTKPNEEVYRNQNEYRFWVGFSDTPAQSDNATIDLPVYPEFVTGMDLRSD